jgi:hypothetical protein
MAIQAILQTIDGKKRDEVVDAGYSLAAIWPCGDQSFPLLQYIDPYGNAVFNGLQMAAVRKELDVLVERVSSDEQRNVLHRIRQLTESCQKEPHLFLRFRGD